MPKPKTTLDGRSGAKSASKPTAELRQIFGPNGPVLDGRRLAPGRHRAGRGMDEADGIPLDDERASRLHATFVVASRSHRMRVADEESRHGTTVNGESVDEAWLADGDWLRLGDSFFVVRYLPPELDDAPVGDIVGAAPATCQLRADIRRVAPHHIDVLIQGDSGTGKELVAHAIHRQSERKGAFVAVNCAAIVSSLAESQLFGHRAGAFSGAVDDQDGFFQAADGGTLFLDEVGDMPAELQPKLLRALEMREVTPVGETQARPVDVRVVAATHRDLDQAVKEGAFRGDLLSRLDQLRLTLTPLRERPEDLAMLTAHFLGDAAARVEPDLFEALLEHPFPYNVRSLRAMLRELEVRGGDADSWGREQLAHRFDRHDDDGSGAPAKTATTTASKTAPTRKELERLAKEHRGNVQAMARDVSRSRMQVYRWLEQYDIDLAAFRDG